MHGSLGSGYDEAVQLGAYTLTKRVNLKFEEQAQTGDVLLKWKGTYQHKRMW